MANAMTELDHFAEELDHYLAHGRCLLGDNATLCTAMARVTVHLAHAYNPEVATLMLVSVALEIHRTLDPRRIADGLAEMTTHNPGGDDVRRN